MCTREYDGTTASNTVSLITATILKMDALNVELQYKPSNEHLTETLYTVRKYYWLWHFWL